MNLLEKLRRRFFQPTLPSGFPARMRIPPDTLRQFPFIQERLDRWIIDKGFCEDIRGNADFARSVGIPPQELSWFFRAVVQEDQRTWLCRLRVEEAMALLRRDPDIPLACVADAVGFSDPSNFSRQFRRFTGSSPQQWRELHYRY